MKVPPDPLTLAALLTCAEVPSNATVSDGIRTFLWRTVLDAPPAQGWQGRSVVVAVRTQLDAARALPQLDGVAARIVLLPPDVKAEHYASIIRDSAADTLLCSDADGFAGLGVTLAVLGERLPDLPPLASPIQTATAWLLLTSGTTGAPKIAIHSLAALTGAIAAPDLAAPRPVWATFYDIRRYGGLQIFLRAVSGGASLVLSREGEAVADHLARLQAASVSHVSGTPSHWRRVLMSDAGHSFTPSYVRLSGEIADQAVLDGLTALYPKAAMGHAYASTEAGVGFDVTDGLEGFPESYVRAPRNGVEMRLADGSLQLRSSRTSSGYAGRPDLQMKDAEGWVDSGDMIEVRQGRCYFAGRRGGIINVGGLKVHPEEIEAVLNRHPAVQQSRVRSRKSPVIGAIVVADIMLKPGTADAETVKQEAMALCREQLPAHKCPAVISVVAMIEMTAGGKVARHA